MGNLQQGEIDPRIQEQSSKMQMVATALEMLDSMETEVKFGSDLDENGEAPASILTQSTFRGKQRDTIKEFLLKQLQ